MGDGEAQENTTKITLEKSRDNPDNTPDNIPGKTPDNTHEPETRKKNTTRDDNTGNLTRGEQMIRELDQMMTKDLSHISENNTNQDNKTRNKATQDEDSELLKQSASEKMDTGLDSEPEPGILGSSQGSIQITLDSMTIKDHIENIDEENTTSIRNRERDLRDYNDMHQGTHKNKKKEAQDRPESQRRKRKQRRKKEATRTNPNRKLRRKRKRTPRDLPQTKNRSTS